MQTIYFFFDDIDANLNHIISLYPGLNSNEINQYFNIEKFIRLDKSIQDFSLLSYDIRSFCSSIDDFHSFLTELNFNFDALRITQSWLDDLTKGLIHFSNYSSYHSLRSNNIKSGDVSVYISNPFKVRLIAECTILNDNIETCFLNLKRDNKRIVSGIVYRPPSGDYKECINTIEGIIEYCKYPNLDNFILCGDFNIDLLNYENNYISLQFLNSIQSNSLLPTITKPTRVTDDTATLIDNIFVMNPINVSFGIVICDISDHFPIFYNKISLLTNSKNNSTIIKYRLINELTLNNLYNALTTYNFTNTINCDDCNIAIESLINIIDDIYNTHCPIRSKQISFKDKQKPWIISEVLNYIKRRQKYFLLYKSNLLPKLLYTTFRNYITNLIRQSKMHFYERKLGNFNLILGRLGR